MSETLYGRYRLLELIGQGGMGQVYRAFDTATDRVVALKVLPPHATEDPTFQQRFRREAQTAAGLTDPHVVPIHGYGEIDGRLYLDMRLIDGQDLGHILKENGQPLAPSLAVRYIEQVAEALNAAHSAALVHRDVKPSNILITPRDFVYLIDFGIARAADETRVTNTGHAVGTFAYMAPERLTPEGESEPRSDIYSLTCVLYECLTGQRPFAGANVEQQITAHLMTPPPRPSATDAKPPESFDAVIEKGLAKDPSDRYQSALELADAARAALDVPAKARAGQKAKPARPAKKPPSSGGKARATAPLSTSASTVLAPTKPAKAAKRSSVSAQARATRGTVVRDRAEPSGGRAFWIVLWVVILLATAVLVAVAIQLF